MKKLYCIIVIIIAFVGICALSLTACSQADALLSDNVYGINKVSSRHLGTVSRNLPETTNGGLARYPQYNKNLANATTEEKQAILAENKAIYDYDKIDKEGNLYKNGLALGKKLTKHSAAEGLYGSALPEDAAACAKRIRITPHNIGNNMTGLYAAPGEVVTIILNQKDAQRNMFVDIGQCNARQGGNNIPVNKNFNRMPMLKTAMRLTETENYIGSPLGGPIYIRNEGGSLDPYEITIIGAIEMPHYFHAFTSDSEWERLKTAPAPLFDMEVYPGIRFSMPASVIRDKSAKQMQEISEFWYKAMCLSNKVSNGNWFKDHPVTMLFDTYIPAGAAVAIVGADCCMLPINWAKSAMNYDSIYKSGAWGTLHEFNHHHQGWGADAGGEVTNNVINALTYMLYTDIAASRTENGGLTGWNWVSDAFSSLNNVLNLSSNATTNTTLSMYVTLAHAFGSDALVEMANNSTAKTHTSWYNAAVTATGYDMTYYLRDICKLNIDQSAIIAVKEQNLPSFIPVASLYQSGIINRLTGETVTMGRPFTVPFGEDKVLDFAKNIACPADYSYEIINIDKPQYGKLVKTGELTYLYTPDKNKLESDEFYLHLKLTNKTSGETIDMSIMLAFKQNADGSSAVIWNNPGYTDIKSAIEDGFENRINPIDKATSEYAGYNDNSKNTIIRTEGQILPPSDGEYEIFIKASGSAILYAGTDKNKLTVMASTNGALKNYSRETASSHFKIKLLAGKPLYYRLYLLNGSTKAFCNIGWSDSSQTEGAPPVVEDGEISDSNAAQAPIVDIPKTYIKHFDAKVKIEESPVITNKYAPNYTVDGLITLDKSGFLATAPAQYKGSAPENMLDDDPSTLMHTQVGISFPVVLSFDMREPRILNMFRFSSRDNSSRGRIKNYVLYGGNSPIDMQVLASGTALDTRTNDIYFSSVSARYLKLEIADHYGNEKYIAISEVEFADAVSNAVVKANTNSAMNYNGDWNENTFGSYMNGILKETKNGTVSYKFHGTGAAVFAKLGRDYGVAEIKIDNGDWQEIDLYSDTDKYGRCVYVASELTDGRHTLTMRVKSGAINLDYIAVNETTEIPASALGYWWIAIAFAIAMTLAAIIVTIILLCKRKINDSDAFRANESTITTDNAVSQKLRFVLREPTQDSTEIYTELLCDNITQTENKPTAVDESKVKQKTVKTRKPGTKTIENATLKNNNTASVSTTPPVAAKPVKKANSSKSQPSVTSSPTRIPAQKPDTESKSKANAVIPAVTSINNTTNKPKTTNSSTRPNRITQQTESLAKKQTVKTSPKSERTAATQQKSAQKRATNGKATDSVKKSTDNGGGNTRNVKTTNTKSASAAKNKEIKK